MFQNKFGRPVLVRMARAIQENKAYLGEVDGLIGDGDHGMNMNKGFTMFLERLPEEISFSEGLEMLGMLLLNEIGGSMGPIYGTLFMEMAAAAEDVEIIDVACLHKMLQEGLLALYDVVDARIGDKTLVDTLEPARRALEDAQATGLTMKAALNSMKEAAQMGKDSTKELVARYGRASRLGERSRGVLDAGAVSCHLLIQAMADGMLEAI